MIAALPMYDRPENRAAHDALWELIRDGMRARGIRAPDALDRATDHMEGWGRPDLVLGQICNLPWRAQFRDRVTILGTADYDIGAGPCEYFSVIVARISDPAPGPRFALNDPLSNSGWDLPQEWARDAGVALRPVLVTGSHAASLRAVVDGRADLAGIDAVTFRAMQRWDEAARHVRIIGQTRTGPGMSFITARGHDPGPMREALEEALRAMPAWVREVLGLRGMGTLPPSAFDRPLPPPPDIARA